MLCENCGKNYANVIYTQIINGVKKEISVCEQCSKKLGIDHLNFDMPIDFASFLSDFFGEYEDTNIFPIMQKVEQLQCPNCETTFEEFINNGKFGCTECYGTFKSKIDPLLQNIHGANRHVGRLGKIKESNKINKDNTNDNNTKEEDKVEELKKELKIAIKEERYEEAAKIRDEIKKLEN
ncbi:MAG: DNA methylase [Clostridia bacterium]|nr:DNA methylase [Clostridia bacterium]